MNKKQVNRLTKISTTVSVDELANKADRTLIYGYTFDRKEFHLYLKDKLFHLVIYTYTQSGVGILQEWRSDSLDCGLCIPNKRAYPEACDYSFCLLLKAKGYEIPFTIWTDATYKSQFHAYVIEGTNFA